MTFSKIVGSQQKECFPQKRMTFSKILAFYWFSLHSFHLIPISEFENHELFFFATRKSLSRQNHKFFFGLDFNIQKDYFDFSLLVSGNQTLWKLILGLSHKLGNNKVCYMFLVQPLSFFFINCCTASFKN